MSDRGSEGAAEPRRGCVTLVGAGPGDPDLLTIRGARRLGEADLVLYDALSSDGMRAYAPRARWFYVGKRACRQSIGQDILNRLMIKEARRGHAVVRLKCGDPFVFGRGGEELLALAEAGIPCEVVPGVSSSVGGPGAGRNPGDAPRGGIRVHGDRRPSRGDVPAAVGRACPREA